MVALLGFATFEGFFEEGVVEVWFAIVGEHEGVVAPGGDFLELFVSAELVVVSLGPDELLVVAGEALVDLHGVLVGDDGVGLGGDEEDGELDGVVLELELDFLHVEADLALELL